MSRGQICLAMVFAFTIFFSTTSSANPLNKLKSEKDCRLAAKGIVECFIIASKQKKDIPDVNEVTKDFAAKEYVKQNESFFSKELVKAISQTGTEFWNMNKKEDLLSTFPRKTLEDWQFESLYHKAKKTPD